MKRVFIPAAALALLLLVLVGCKDENHPKITRIVVSESCGVAPMNVEVYGTASGGNEDGGPTGGVNNLEYTWDFGEEGATSTTSIAYHTYADSGVYTISLMVKDEDGRTNSNFVKVEVIADSLFIEPLYQPAGSITVGTPVEITYLARSCSVDPGNPDDYVKLSQSWLINAPASTDTLALYRGRDPVHTFTAAGTYDVHLTVFFAEWDLYRHASTQIVVAP